jgi:hypothetical protein
LALAPTAKSLAVTRDLHFSLSRQDSIPSLGLSVALLQVPDGMSVTDALAALRKADPEGTYDYDHVYDPSGNGSQHAESPATATPESSDVRSRLGMIDAGIDRKHPAFAAARIVARNFANDGDSPPSSHGTAVASLLIGSDEDFHGALPGSTLYVADVFGGEPAGGSADDIVRALGWLAQQRLGVVNISLAGPPNALLEAAVQAFAAHGGVVVAAVGNNGPAAPLSYPAAYHGVASVTSVNSDRTVEIDASTGARFAALGVDVPAAKPGGSYMKVTGTSYAAPVVASRFALLLPQADAAMAARAWSTLERSATRLGFATYGYLDPPTLSTGAAAMR